MRSKVYVWGKQSIATIARNMYKNKTRLQALFLCLVIFAGAVIPTASVYAAEQAAKPKVSKPLSADQPLQFAAAADNGKQLVSDPVLNSQPEQNVQRERKYEDESKRTATTKTYVNTDGSRTLDYSIMPMHYQRDGKWVDLNAVTEADNSFRSATPLEKEPLIGNPFAKKPQSYNFSAGELGVKLHTYNDGIEFTFKGKQFKLKPAGANNVRPTVTETEEGHKIITYKEAWPGVDVDYEVHGAMLKETIVLKRPGTTNVFVSRLEGVKAKPHSKHKGALELEGINPDELFISPLTVNVNQKGLISEEVAKQTVNGNVFAITVDAQWLRSQPKDSFPIAVDPTFYHDVGGTYGLFKAYKSDGYMCESSTCDPQAGRLNDNGYKWWRTMFRIPFEELKYNKKVLGASIHLVKKQRSYWTGYDGWKSIHTSWAPCFGFNCTHDKSYQYGAGANTNDWSDVRRTVAWMSGEDNPDPQWGGWFMMWGDEGSDSYKQFEPTSLVMSVLFDTPTPMAQAIAPADKQIVVTSQPSLSINPVSDADGEAVQYYFQVSSNPDAKTGAVINSGWTKSTQWTVPDGILQDGTTYYWHAYTTGATQTDPNWVRSFKYDMRTGKDSTQAYDTVGPMSIDLATGNATTSTGTHTMSALGGSMGLSLDYNTPAKSRPGLVGEYWNNVSRDGVPGLTRVDPNIEFLWGEGTPAAGVINPDNFSARWAGYLTVPTTGNYYFGGHIDDGYNIYINEQLHHNVSGTGTFFGNTPVYLEAGKPARIRVEFYEAGGNATFRMLARGAVTEQVVPSTWLQTGIRQTSQQYGLVGRYYNDEGGSRTFPANNDDPMRLIMTRTDPKISFNWADGAPVPGAPSDRFLVRWRGYVTVPVNGAYQFGGASDDGLRMWINNQQVINDWVDRGTTQSWGAAVNLTAGQTVPVTIEYYENGGGATMNFNVKGAVPEQEVPATWLSPKALAVPEGWQIGVDVDGDISYERLRTSGANVILTDSSGQTHEYTWNESVYKAPVNEEGQLVRNANGTYTLVDTDGRTYIFDSEGKLTSVTTPQDDKQPAALKYEYAGDPSRLMKIVDGVTSSRFATLHYKSVNEEGNCTQSAGFDAAPTGMLCAFKTTDGDTTRLQYKNGRLARVEKPGNELLDYGYDTAGRIVNVRDSVANDAVGAGIRAEDATVTTEVSYDELGRVAAVKAPAAQANSNRTNHTFEYLPGTAPVFGVAQMHITGAPEPAGFSKRIEYDTLFRTIRETDAANLSSVTEWDSVKDLSLSTTDATGLKSTTIYDSEDRPIESYGPAPAAWYDTDRKPLAANSSQVPRTQTNYDEGIRGLNVSIYDNKKLLGVPKIHTTAFNNVPYVSYGVDAASGITPTDGLALRASGKILLNQTGNYSFRAWHSDGMRIYVDNQLVVDNWLDGGERWSPSGTFNNSTANRWVNYRVDVYKTGTTGRVFAHLHMTPPGSAEQTDFAHLLTPAYNLQTSQTAYDAQLGNVTSKTEYDKPEYGLVKKAVLDPTGLNYETSNTYETPGNGYLRQLSKTLPGGGTTNYQHYSATDTLDNPCTVSVEAFQQAGMTKGKAEADPDGAGPLAGRTSETIYDASGQVVATRYNNDPWTCTSYDARGRVLQTVVPALGSKPGRTIVNNWAVDGNPLKVSSGDSNGYITTITDLLGRTVSYTDVHGNTTTSTYDDLGRLTQRQGPLGTEAFTYDSVDRLVDQKLDGTIVAIPHYDQYGRLSSVDYPTAGTQKLSSITRDDNGRTNGLSYTLGDGSTVSDQVTRSQSGQILTNARTDGSNVLNGTFGYDKASRLTSATIGSNTYTYGFGPQDASCAAGTNASSGKNSNRTSMTINGAATTFCYDFADRLVSSSDPELNGGQYDDHGNTTILGSNATPLRLAYDSSDRNSGLEQFDSNITGIGTYYKRDVQGRITERKRDTITTGTHQTTSEVKYGFTASGDTPDYVMNMSGAVTEKTLSLPGGALITLRPNETDASKQAVHSLPNIHGDVMVTTDKNGTKTGLFAYDPFGNPLSGTPDNTVTGSTYSWVGQHEKLTETDFALSPTEMGARVYISKLGRFLQVDPVEGGVENSYVYPPDPVNKNDISGMCPMCVPLGMIAVRAALPVIARQSAKHGPAIYRTVRSAKTAKEVTQVGRFTKTVWTTNARNVGGAARSVMTKIKDEKGVTRRVIKDTFDKNNKLLHRKYKLWWK